MNEEITIIYSKRCVAQAALLFWKKRILSIRSMVLPFIISVFLVFTVAGQKEKIPLGELIALSVVLILPWGMLLFGYFVILVRLRRILGRTIKCVLHDDRISWSSDRGTKEALWSDFDMYAKSSEVTLFYSSKTKVLFVLPNAMVSEKVQAYMLEKFNEAGTGGLKPPVIARASDIKRKHIYIIVIVVVLVLALAALVNHRDYRYFHSPVNASMETNNVIQH